MTTDVDLTTAVSQQFPSASPRASLDCLAFNILAAEVPAVLQYLRDVQGFDFLTDLTAIDWTAETSPRFTVIWHLYSSGQHRYVRVAADCTSATEPVMPSATGLWAGADWHERECYDMFGIIFTGHPDLRRILTDYGFQGHPLRKDFPLSGYTEVRYDATEKRVISEPLQLAQEFRSFDFASPWESLDKGTK